MTELERTKEALKVAREAMSQLSTHYVDIQKKHLYCSQQQDAIDHILNPPPEMETVETEAFRCPSCMRLHETDKNDCICGKYCSQFIRLTGSFTRPKVERSVSVEAMVDTVGDVFGPDNYGILKDYPFRHHAECHGKTGTLTFTWTE